MKKSFLTLALTAAVFSQAQAAVVTPNASYDVAVNGTTYSFTEAAATQVYEFSSVWNATLDFTRLTNQTVFSWFEDTDAAFNGSVSYTNADLISRFTLTSAATTFSVALAAGKTYVLTVSRDTTGGAGSASAVATVPVPAAAWLFGSAMFGAASLRRKQKNVLA